MNLSTASQVERLAYVIDALRRQAALYRRSAWPVPDGVTSLVTELGFEVTRGQEGSAVASPSRTEHVENTRPIAVRYETAAQMMEVSVSTIKRMIRAGELNPVCIGGARRLRVADIEAFVGEQVSR